MKINHIAIWVKNIEKSKEFYCKYFNGTANEKYENYNKGFSSYFITFESGARLEIMKRIDIKKEDINDKIGIAHIAFSVGSIEKVDMVTEKMREDGFIIYGEPRVTGDGYYESVVLDCDGIKIEITE